MYRHPVTNMLTKAQLKVAKNLNLNLKNSGELVKLGLVLPYFELIKECLMTWEDALDILLKGGERKQQYAWYRTSTHSEKQL